MRFGPSDAAMDPKVRHDSDAEVRVIEGVGLNTIPNQSKTDELLLISRRTDCICDQTLSVGELTPLNEKPVS